MATSFTLPKNTCPIIDGIKDQIDEAMSDLELVRTANADLRNAAETWQSEIEDAENKVEQLEQEVVDLKDEIARLNAEIEALHKQSNAA